MYRRRLFGIALLFLSLFGLSLLASASTRADAPSIEKILIDLPVSTAQALTQQTPIATRGGEVFIANIEPSPSGDTRDLSLLTVVRHGRRHEDGTWHWAATVVDDSTAHDKWHTPPAIALDRDGYVHVAYNMHNLPWQYKVSAAPVDIGVFEFRGQAVSREDLENVYLHNRSSFKTHGKAAIPGNQITYPAFFHDREETLYVTYRFAAKPARSFADRAMSAGIARYDNTLREWTGVGPPIRLVSGDYYQPWFTSITTPSVFAMRDGWTAYHPRLAFGPDNTMHVTWFWRKGIAGNKLQRPCNLVSHDRLDFAHQDGTPVKLPATPDDCGELYGSPADTYYADGSTTTNSRGELYVVLSPTEGDREIWYFHNGDWRVEKSPYGATELFFDAKDTLWAIGSGPTVLKREPNERDWTTVYREEPRTNCSPRAALNSERTAAFLYTLGCDAAMVTVYHLSLVP